MNILFTTNAVLNCPRWVCGDWSCDLVGLEETSADEVIDIYEQEGFKTLYELLGFEMHCQQQLQCDVYFKNMQVVPLASRDTAGGSLYSDTLLEISNKSIKRLGVLSKDSPITFKGSE